MLRTAVGLELSATGSYHATTFALVVLVCGLSAIPLCLPTPQTPATPSAKSNDDPDEQGRLLGGDETESDASVYAGEDKAADRARLRAERALLVAVFSFIFLYCIAELSIGTWVPAYATIRGLTTPTEAAALGSWFWLCFTVGRISGICVSRWLSSIRMIAVDLGLLLAAVVSSLPHYLVRVPLSPAPDSHGGGCCRHQSTMVATDGYAGPGSGAIVWSCMGVYGFGLGTIVAASMTMLAESGVEMTGSRAAGQNVFGLCGDVSGQALMSVIFTELGPERFMQAAWLTIAASSVLFAFIAGALVPRMRRHKR